MICSRIFKENPEFNTDILTSLQVGLNPIIDFRFHLYNKEYIKINVSVRTEYQNN